MNRRCRVCGSPRRSLLWSGRLGNTYCSYRCNATALRIFYLLLAIIIGVPLILFGIGLIGNPVTPQDYYFILIGAGFFFLYLGFTALYGFREKSRMGRKQHQIT